MQPIADINNQVMPYGIAVLPIDVPIVNNFGFEYRWESANLYTHHTNNYDYCTHSNSSKGVFECTMLTNYT